MTMMDTSNKTDTISELDWIQVREELNQGVKTESFTQKFVRKTIENPLVPIGGLATIGALTYGLWNFYKGNSAMSQYMMRCRVAAQGFTIVSMALGFVLLSKKQSD